MATAHEAVINIIYKRSPELKLDVDYLVNTHIPLCAKTWESNGLLGATVTQAPADSEYAYIINVRFEKLEGWQTATSDVEAMGPIMADMANFTNVTPDFVVGTVVKGGLINIK